MSSSKNLNLIQLLRGIASLLVVLMHATQATNENLRCSFLFEFFKFGGAGVDIFFVLSGFIITYTSRNALNRGSGFLPFIKKRFVRIFPTYWIVISLFLLLQIALPSFYRTHYELTAGNLANTYLLLPGHIMVNGVSWTLTYELFFYFLFSLAFVLREKRLIFLLSLLYVIALMVPYINKHAESDNGWFNLIFFPMNVEFFLGITAALLIPKMRLNYAVPFITGGVLLFLAAAIAYNNGYSIFNSTFNRVIFFGIPSFFIIVGVVVFELKRSVKVHGALVLLGEASYSLYLLHLPIVVAGVKILARFNSTNSWIIHTSLLILILAICIGSICFFKWIERPLINKLNNLLQTRKVPSN